MTDSLQPTQLEALVEAAAKHSYETSAPGFTWENDAPEETRQQLRRMLRPTVEFVAGYLVTETVSGEKKAGPAERHMCSGSPCSTQHHAFYGQLCNVPNCREDFCIGCQEFAEMHAEGAR